MNTKNISKIVLVLIAMSITMIAAAQDSLSWALGTIAITRNGDEIGIGDKVPDISLQKILNNDVASSSIHALNNKPVIIEFWHQYCSVCRGEIPKLNQLYNAYKDSVQFLMVTFQSEADTRFFMQQQAAIGKPILLPVAVEDTLLRKTFGHEGDPHVVWIGEDGTVQAITSHLALSDKHIAQWLRDKDIHLATKSNSRHINTDDPLLIRGDEDQSADKKYYARLTGYIDSVSSISFHATETENGLKVLITNATIDQIFKEFYTRYDTASLQFLDVDWLNKHIDFRYKDSSRTGNWNTAYESGYDAMNYFEQHHLYSFEIFAPVKSMQELAGYALQELQQQLQIKAFTDSINISGLALIRLNKQEKFKMQTVHSREADALQDSLLSTSGEAMWSLVNVINLHFNMPLVVDETGYTGKIDVSVPYRKNDIAALKKSLQQYGLGLVPKTYRVPVLVLQDE
ncbi:MAG TPA: TlpA disulfide reductase family protein [Panacibacter sp.]|nr:TlpA disulfide reductase family protein [Panacibacter sp.]